MKQTTGTVRFGTSRRARRIIFPSDFGGKPKLTTNKRNQHHKNVAQRRHCPNNSCAVPCAVPCPYQRMATTPTLSCFCTNHVGTRLGTAASMSQTDRTATHCRQTQTDPSRQSTQCSASKWRASSTACVVICGFRNVARQHKVAALPTRENTRGVRRLIEGWRTPPMPSP